MAVNRSIGKVLAAIQAGRKANAHIDYGPIRGIHTDMIEYDHSDFHEIDIDPNLFVFGHHKWGSTTYKVTA